MHILLFSFVALIAPVATKFYLSAPCVGGGGSRLMVFRSESKTIEIHSSTDGSSLKKLFSQTRHLLPEVTDTDNVYLHCQVDQRNNQIVSICTGTWCSTAIINSTLGTTQRFTFMNFTIDAGEIESGTESISVQPINDTAVFHFSNRKFSYRNKITSILQLKGVDQINNHLYSENPNQVLGTSLDPHRKQAIIGAFRTDLYAYFIRSVNLAYFVNGPISKWRVLLTRICLGDSTDSLRSWLELSLDCGPPSKDASAEFAATRAYILGSPVEQGDLYILCEQLTHDGNRISATKNRVVKHSLNSLLPQFDLMWTTCQSVTETSSCKSGSQTKPANCDIRSKANSNQYCEQYDGGTLFPNVCKLRKDIGPQDSTHLWNVSAAKGLLMSEYDYIEPNAKHDKLREVTGHAKQLFVSADGSVAHVLDYSLQWRRLLLNPVSHNGTGVLLQRTVLADEAVFVHNGLVKSFTSPDKLDIDELTTCRHLYSTIDLLHQSRGRDPKQCVWCIAQNWSLPLSECKGAYVISSPIPIVTALYETEPNIYTILGQGFKSFGDNISAEICKHTCTIESPNTSKDRNDEKLTCSTKDEMSTSLCFLRIQGQLEQRPYTIDFPTADNSQVKPLHDAWPNDLTLGFMITGFVIVAFIFVCCAIIYCRYRRKPKQHRRFESDNSMTQFPMAMTGLEERQQASGGGNRYEPQAGSSAYGGERQSLEDMTHLVPAHILVPINQVDLIRPIGQGHFGMVYEAKINRPDGAKQHVAVKSLKEVERNARTNREFLQEGLLMEPFNHAHVMSLVGITFDGVNAQIITPFMPSGDLLTFLQSPSNTPTMRKLLDFAVQISEGMNYLHKLKFIHRDLAARNCMLDEMWNVKIADFGLCRDVYESECYQQTTDRDLPTRWLSPEALDRHEYTKMGDVWSYGVVVWEIMTRGAQPYVTETPELPHGFTLYELLSWLFQGNRLTKPPYCPDLVYQKIMLPCWSLTASERPTFAQLCITVPSVIDILLKGSVQTQMDSPYERVLVRRSAPAS